jgi:putative ABC transport system permease protein
MSLSVLPRSEEVGLNIPVLLYTLVISLAVGIFSGLVPAYINRSAAPHSALKQGSRGSTVSHRRTQSIFVVAQISLTLVLLLSAGLLLRTIAHLRSVDPGFSTENIISLDVGVPHSLTTAPTKTRIAYGQLIERIRQIGGVEAADFSTAVPLTGKGGYLPFWLDSHKPDSLQGAPRMRWSQTGPDYLRTMGMQLLQGRFLREQDTVNTPCVVAVDQDFATKFFPHESPIGHAITAGFAAFGPCAIVGVVNHVKSAALDDASLSNEYQAYYSLAQVPDKWVPLNYPDASIVVRTPLSTDALVRAIKRSESDTVTVYNVHTVRDILSDSMSEQRFPLIMLGSFGVLALLLASVGIYGMVSYSVTQRLQEIGIRMALGADKGKVLRMFVAQQLQLVCIGLVFGAAGAWLALPTASKLSHLIHGVKPTDPLTFAVCSMLLVSTAVLAAYIPARRATRIDPLVTLRSE